MAGNEGKTKTPSFAERAQWPLGKNALARAWSKREERREDVLNLTESNPTRCDFAFPGSDIQAALNHPLNLAYTPSPRGLLEARQALCRYYQAQKINLETDQLFLTASTSEAYAFLFRLLVNPGETVLFPRPSYPLFDFLGGLNDVAVDYYPLRFKQAWRPDLREFRSRLNPSVKAVVLVNPNNPTGSFIRHEDFIVMAELCAERGIPLISDEVFFDYRLDQAVEPYSLLGYQDHLTFVLGGLSKALALPQMKLSWIIMNGPAEDRREAGQRLEIIADTYLSVSTPIQHALKTWLTLQPGIHDMIMKRVNANYRGLKTMLASSHEIRCLTVEGGWAAVLRLPEKFSEEAFVLELLNQDGVGVYPGYFFDFEQEPLIVVSLLPAEAIFREAMLRLQKRVKVGIC